MESPIKTLVHALNTDDQYRIGWKASIAMNFVDEVMRFTNEKGFYPNTYQDVHALANGAADNFLQQLTRDK